MEDMDPGYHGTGDVDAMRKAQQEKLIGAMEELLNRTTARNIEDTKEEVRKVVKHKPKMQQKSFYLCDSCSVVVAKPEDGYIIHGNIYTADTSCRGGIIGNNFPEVKPGDSITVESVQETVFCKKCFLKALGVTVMEVEESAIGKLKKMAEGVNITQDRSPRRNAYRSTTSNDPPRSAPQHGYGSFDPGIEAFPENSAVDRDDLPRIYDDSNQVPTSAEDYADRQPDGGWRDPMPSVTPHPMPSVAPQGTYAPGHLAWAEAQRIRAEIRLAQAEASREQGSFNEHNFRGILNG